MFAWVCLCFEKARYLQWAFPQRSSCHPLGHKVVSYPTQFHQQEAKGDKQWKMLPMSSTCRHSAFHLRGSTTYTREEGRMDHGFIITGVCTSSPWLSSFWDDLSPWRKQYSSLKLSTLPVRVLVMFLLYSVLTPVIFYFFREKCAR